MDRAAKGLRSANEEAALERERVARLREREALARTIHDSILQLAVVHRRGQSLRSGIVWSHARCPSSSDWWTARNANLNAAAHRSRRSAGRGRPAPNRARSGSVRDHRGGGVRQHGRARLGAAGAAAEVSAAVRAALDNVVRHAGASQATVFGECEEGQLIVSIRDDGVGFEPAALEGSNGRFGISHSIVGRIEDLAARYGSTARAGRGTEVEFRVPVATPGGNDERRRSDQCRDRGRPSDVARRRARRLEGSGVATVVGEADDGGVAEVVGQTAPDVVVMDLDLLTVRGVDAIREIVKISPSAKILVLSVSGAESDVLEAVKNGAAGYLLKSSTAEQLIDGIRRVNEGDAVFTPALAGLVLTEFRRGAPTEEPGLSERENEVLRLVAKATRTGRSPSSSSSAARRCRTTSATS